MPIARFQMPDGRVARFEVPEGTTPEQAQALIEQEVGRRTQARANAEQQTAADNKRFGPTGSFFENAAAGLGKAMYDTGRGIGQMAGLVSQQEVDEAARLDAPLMRTAGGLAGNIGGQVAQLAAPGAGLAKLPMLGPVLSSAMSGGAFAATQPVLEGDTRLGNAGLGAAFGAGGQVVSNAVGAAAKKGVDAVTPEVRALYQRAQQLGIPVNAAQLGNSKFVKTLQSTLERLPLTGAQASRDKQLDAWRKAVSNTFGENTDKITSDVYASAKSRLGQGFESVSTRNTLNVSPKVVKELTDLFDETKRFATADTEKAVRNAIEETFGKANMGPNGIVVEGKAYQALDSKLGKLSAAGGEKGHYLGQLRSTLRTAMDDSISPADKQTWDGLRRQYRNLKTVRDLVAKEGASGEVNPSLLMGRVNATQAGKEAMASGRGGEMGELAAIGKQFIRDPIPDSGTAQRAMTLGLLGGGAGTGLYMDPESTLATLALSGLLGRGANSLLNSRAGTAYVLNGGLPGLMAPPARALPYLAPPVGLLATND